MAGLDVEFVFAVDGRIGWAGHPVKEEGHAERDE